MWTGIDRLVPSGQNIQQRRLKLVSAKKNTSIENYPSGLPHILVVRVPIAVPRCILIFSAGIPYPGYTFTSNGNRHTSDTCEPS